MPEYINPHKHELRLVGPTNQIVKIPPRSKIVLADWFNKYCPKYLTPSIKAQPVKKVEIKPKIRPTEKPRVEIRVQPQPQPKPQPQPPKPQPKPQPPQSQSPPKPHPIKSNQKPKVASLTPRYRPMPNDPQNDAALAEVECNEKIGIGILSFNRLNCIKRLLESIYKNTDLSKVSIFVSDESTDPEVINYLKQQDKITVITDQSRVGIARNSNKLLRLLEKFEYCLLLNDDTEVLKSGWERFYAKASKITRYHHFCYRQNGVYGANNQEGAINKIRNVKIRTISRKPHGAVLFYTNQLFNKIGFFDAKFPMYGLEHTDWSNRASKTDLVPPGFHDVIDSNIYFRIHNDKSAAPDNKNDLIRARQYYNMVSKDKSRIHIPLE